MCGFATAVENDNEETTFSLWGDLTIIVSHNEKVRQIQPTAVNLLQVCLVAMGKK